MNLIVTTLLTLVFHKFGLQDGYDETRPADYLADPVIVPRAAPGRSTPRLRHDPVADTTARLLLRGQHPFSCMLAARLFDT